MKTTPLEMAALALVLLWILLCIVVRSGDPVEPSLGEWPKDAIKTNQAIQYPEGWGIPK